MEGGKRRKRSNSQSKTPSTTETTKANVDEGEDFREKYLPEKLLQLKKGPKVTIKTAQKTLTNLLKDLGIEDEEAAERLEKKRQEQEKALAFRYLIHESIESLKSAQSTQSDDTNMIPNKMSESRKIAKDVKPVGKSPSSIKKRKSGEVLRPASWDKKSLNIPKRKVSFSSVTYMNIDGKEIVDEISQDSQEMYEVKAKATNNKLSTTFVKTPPKKSSSKKSIGSSSNSTLNSLSEGKVSLKSEKEVKNVSEENQPLYNKRTLRIFTETKDSSGSAKNGKSGVWKDEKENKEFVAHTRLLTDKEFKLLNEAVPAPKPANKRPLKEIRNVQKALFNWANDTLKNDKPKQTEVKVEKPSNPKQTEKSQTSSSKATEKSQPASLKPAEESQSEKVVNEKKKQKKQKSNVDKANEANEANEEKIKKKKNEANSSRDHQTQFESRVQHGESQYKRSDAKENQGGEGEIATVEGKAEAMRESVFIASEAIYILANTIFKDAPYEKDLLIKSSNKEFQGLLNAQNDLEALKKVSSLFQGAEESIEDYLRYLVEEKIEFPIKTNFARRSLHAFPSLASMSTAEEDFQVPSEFNLRNTISRTSQSWQFPMIENPYKAELALKVWRGKITETICSKDAEFQAVFDGNREKIKNLIAAGRVKAEATSLSPKILYQMVDRACSLIVTKLVTMKYFTLTIIKEIAVVTESSVLKPILPYIFKGEKAPKRIVRKLRAINVFSGILYQISFSATTGFSKIRKAIEKAKMIKPQAPFQRIPGIEKTNDELDDEQFPIEARIPVQDGMKELNEFMEEAENLYMNAKISLKALHHGVKLKSSHMKMLRIAYQATKNLFKPDKDLDIGTILMSINCNISIIVSFNEIVPNAETISQTNMTLSLNKLRTGVEQLENMYSSLKLIALFLAKCSIANLSMIRKYNEERHEAHERKKRWLAVFVGTKR